MPTPIRPIIFLTYPPASIASMADLLHRASLGKAIDIAALEIDLLGVIYATGIGREDSEAAAWWHDEGKESHLKIARQFISMADASNPLDPAACTEALRPELNGLIVTRWTERWQREKRGNPSLRTISWESLTAGEQKEISEMARTLAAFHKSLAPAWRPQKDLIDTLLLLLAVIFANHAGYPGGYRSLPHSVRSYFILFAGEALEPFFDPSEISAIALGHRWNRLKKDAVDALPRPDDAR